MVVTTATIARDILVKAAAGVIDTDTFPGAAFTVDQLATIWYANMPETSYPWVDDKATDVDEMQSTVVDTAKAGATLVYWDLVIANGQTTVADIDAAVTADSYLVPSSLTGGSGAIELANAISTLPGPIVNNDPFGAFPDLGQQVPC